METQIKKTTDLSLAAYLSVAGVPFEGGELHPNNPGQVVFTFRDELGNFDALTQSYFSRKLVKMRVLSYVDELRNFKSMTHALCRKG